MAEKSTYTDNNVMISENERRKRTITLHSHHNGGSLRRETAKHTLRCLLGCNIGEGIGAAIGFVLGMDMTSTLILAIGLAFAMGYAFTMIPMLKTMSLKQAARVTTGAITGMIDRLEKAGYVRRTNDPKDRRKTIVEPVRNKKLERKIEMIFRPLHERMHKFLSSYSDSELTLLLDAMTKLIAQTREESKRLQNL